MCIVLDYLGKLLTSIKKMFLLTASLQVRLTELFKRQNQYYWYFDPMHIFLLSYVLYAMYMLSSMRGQGVTAIKM